MRLAGWVMVAGLGCGRVGFGDLSATNGNLDRDGGDGDVALATCATALLCDEFETGDLSRWTSTTLIGNATANVVATRPHGGTYALESTSPLAAGASTASPQFAIPLTSAGTLAVRAWINTTVLIENYDLVLELTNQAEEYTTLGGDGAATWVSSEYRTSSIISVDHHSPITVPPIDTWTCVELVVTLQPPAGPHIQAFANGVNVLDTVGITPSPSYDSVGIGIVRGDELGFHLFVDDVVIADRRIGCQ